MRLTTLKKSAEFKRVRGGQRSGNDAFLIEGKSQTGPASHIRTDTPGDTRFGFTVTKKLGGAVVRNKIRRRLKSIVRDLDADAAAPGHDYVVVARRGVVSQSYASLAADFRRALEKIHRAAPPVSAAPKGQRVQADSASERPSVSGTGATDASKRA